LQSGHGVVLLALFIAIRRTLFIAASAAIFLASSLVMRFAIA
jgi:hypothetical protein